MDVGVCLKAWEEIARYLQEQKERCLKGHPDCDGSIECPFDLMLQAQIPLEKANKYCMYNRIEEVQVEGEEDDDIETD